jgi:hypothetical protein
MTRQTILRVIIIAAATISFQSNAFSQRVEAVRGTNGVGLFSSGNGHGTFAGFSFHFNRGNKSLGISPFVQLKNGNFSGMRLIYCQSLSSDRVSWSKSEFTRSDLLQLNFHSYLQYNGPSQLSDKVIREESMIRRESARDWSQVKVSTGEAGAGIELQINITPFITVKNRIAAAVYYHFSDIQAMSHERIAPSLHLGSSVYFNIN